MSDPWSGSQAERHLRSLELFGMRFGLDRMRRMMTALGSPERSFRSIHVLGTNGKSSTTRMIAAILERHGLRTGTYTSPHLVSYGERVQVGERDIDPGAFAGAVARAAAAAERVNRTLGEDDHVTQFELLTAAAFWELARQGVEVAVIEAGLGGRYDATSVIESEVTVLTNVGLEHTRWLGPTVADIAAEKLAVLAPGKTLALGGAMHEDALAVARTVAQQQGAQIVQAGALWSEPLLADGRFQRANFALAKTAAEAYLKKLGTEPRVEAVREAALHTVAPGRMQVIGEEPLTVLDGAHNPDAARALAESLPELVRARPLGLVLGVLEDKDAAAMLRTLLALCERAWFTAPPSARALSPAALQSLARQQGFEEVRCEPHPRRALVQAREWAQARAPQRGAVLATGSIYLVGDLLAERCEAASSHGEPARVERGVRRIGQQRGLAS
ncbi:MAG TPA: folylpolyglutamate synthase/dihydrofolate synthase family protein [Solirubrobacteraceae bacterium]|jgi:dihydrofolate synthase/folylpolyglutamate synthase